MSLPRTAAEILREHVTLEVECIDRMYLNAYVPQLQYESGVAAFFRQHRGHPFASSVLMDPISKAFVAAIHAFVQDQGVPLLTFEKGQRKDDVMAEHLARCLNGHEYVKRQLAQRGIAFEALDNGIRSCADPRRLQALCAGLSASSSS